MTDATNPRAQALAAAEPFNAYADHAEAIIKSMDSIVELYHRDDAINDFPLPMLPLVFKMSLDECAAELATWPAYLRDHAETIRATARRDPWDDVPEGWRDDLKLWPFEPEMMGGGCWGLRHSIARNGWSVLLTCAEGGGMPDADSWHVGVYEPVEPCEAVWQEMHNEGEHGHRSRLTFHQAVAAACAMASAGEAAPPPLILQHLESARAAAMDAANASDFAVGSQWARVVDGIEQAQARVADITAKREG